MSDFITNVSDASFEADVIKAEGPVLVDYWADRSSLTAARVTLARIGFDLVESEQTPTDSCTATAAR